MNLLFVGIANSIDDHILDMIGSVMVMHFNETYKYYPKHLLHTKMLNFNNNYNTVNIEHII